ncbi:hypothetical protein D3C76_1270030 [compost metagenome]
MIQQTIQRRGNLLKKTILITTISTYGYCSALNTINTQMWCFVAPSNGSNFSEISTKMGEYCTGLTHIALHIFISVHDISERKPHMKSINSYRLC